MGDITYYTNDNLELKINRTKDGVYHMIISKDYIFGSKKTFFEDASKDLQHLVNQFEQLKLKECNKD